MQTNSNSSDGTHSSPFTVTATQSHSVSDSRISKSSLASATASDDGSPSKPPVRSVSSRISESESRVHTKSQISSLTPSTVPSSSAEHSVTRCSTFSPSYSGRSESHNESSSKSLSSTLNLTESHTVSDSATLVLSHTATRTKATLPNTVTETHVMTGTLFSFTVIATRTLTFSSVPSASVSRPRITSETIRATQTHSAAMSSDLTLTLSAIGTYSAGASKSVMVSPSTSLGASPTSALRPTRSSVFETQSLAKSTSAEHLRSLSVVERSLTKGHNETQSNRRAGTSSSELSASHAPEVSLSHELALSPTVREKSVSIVPEATLSPQKPTQSELSQASASLNSHRTASPVHAQSLTSNNEPTVSDEMETTSSTAHSSTQSTTMARSHTPSLPVAHSPVCPSISITQPTAAVGADGLRNNGLWVELTLGTESSVRWASSNVAQSISLLGVTLDAPFPAAVSLANASLSCTNMGNGTLSCSLPPLPRYNKGPKPLSSETIVVDVQLGALELVIPISGEASFAACVTNLSASSRRWDSSIGQVVIQEAAVTSSNVAASALLAAATVGPLLAIIGDPTSVELQMLAALLSQTNNVDDTPSGNCVSAEEKDLIRFAKYILTPFWDLGSQMAAVIHAGIIIGVCLLQLLGGLILTKLKAGDMSLAKALIVLRFPHLTFLVSGFLLLGLYFTSLELIFNPRSTDSPSFGVVGLGVGISLLAFSTYLVVKVTPRATVYVPYDKIADETAVKPAKGSKANSRRSSVALPAAPAQHPLLTYLYPRGTYEPAPIFKAYSSVQYFTVPTRRPFALFTHVATLILGVLLQVARAQLPCVARWAVVAAWLAVAAVSMAVGKPHRSRFVNHASASCLALLSLISAFSAVQAAISAEGGPLASVKIGLIVLMLVITIARGVHTIAMYFIEHKLRQTLLSSMGKDPELKYEVIDFEPEEDPAPELDSEVNEVFSDAEEVEEDIECGHVAESPEESHPNGDIASNGAVVDIKLLDEHEDEATQKSSNKTHDHVTDTASGEGTNSGPTKTEASKHTPNSAMLFGAGAASRSTGAESVQDVAEETFSQAGSDDNQRKEDIGESQNNHSASDAVTIEGDASSSADDDHFFAFGNVAPQSNNRRAGVCPDIDAFSDDENASQLSDQHQTLVPLQHVPKPFDDEEDLF
eukprot:GILK01013112.1.p1 GENE.GILK01013112.1~~GILK01013112.1.p1  ORF type:complete len:1215 (+),score=48.60 GILK01013112.1:151-3645(+)